MASSVLKRRIRVQTQTKVVTARSDHPVLMVAIGAQSALLLAGGPLARRGETVDLHLPGLSGDVIVTAGVERLDPVHEGTVITVNFIVVDQQMRKQLKELLSLLLAGDGGGDRRHPRIKHDLPLAYGEKAQHPAQLEEISLAGIGMRTRERLKVGSQVKVTFPDDRNGARIVMLGQVVNERFIEDKNEYAVGVAFVKVDTKTRAALEELLAGLVRG
jgi:hypothetical protein